MADRFPDIPQPVDPGETHINYFFDRLIACVKYGQAPGKLWLPHAVAIDSNTNQIYVTDGAHLTEGNRNNIARVSIFSETGEFLNTFSHPHMKYPHSIAIHRDSVYVTDIVERCVFHFTVEADFPLATRLGSRGTDIGQFNEHRQLAVSTNRKVLVAGHKNNRIQETFASGC